MVFIFYSNLALEFLALAAGTALFIWALQKKADGCVLATFIGLFIIIFSFIAVVSTLVYGGKAWVAGQLSVTQTPQKTLQIQELNQMEQMIERMKDNLKGQKGPGSAQ